jgi:endonuclease YncB( thermonuclease family)
MVINSVRSANRHSSNPKDETLERLGFKARKAKKGMWSKENDAAPVLIPCE